MPSAPIQRGFETALGRSKNIISTGVVNAVDRLRPQTPATRLSTGTDVRGRASRQTLDITVGLGGEGSDGFTVTLPGTETRNWQCTLTVIAGTFISGDVAIFPVLGEAVFPSIDLRDGTGLPSATTAVVTVPGGTAVPCAAGVIGPPGETYSVTLDFSAITIPGGP